MKLESTAWAIAICLLGCKASSTKGGTDTGGKTNWLQRCDEDADCGDLLDAVCVTERCTKACDGDATCAPLGDDLRCATPKDGTSSGAVCLPECDSEESCAVMSGCDAGDECDPNGVEPEPGEAEPDDGPQGAGGAPPSPPSGDQTATPPTSVPTTVSMPTTTSAPTMTSIPTTTSTPMPPLACVSPDDVSRAYECPFEGCTCSAAEGEPTCVQGEDGRWVALDCVDGAWTLRHNSLCAVGATGCFDLEQNVDLARSGSIAGCACDEDEFGCAVDGELRVPMQCGADGRWQAMPDGDDCEGLFQELCANVPEETQDAGSQTPMEEGCSVDASDPSLPGVTIHLEADRCTYRSGEGGQFRYRVELTQSLAFETESSGGSCGLCGSPTELDTWAAFNLGGEGVGYCYCDVGCCLPTEVAPAELVAQSQDRVVEWPGLQWGGPSDTGQEPAGVFPPGDYAASVRLALPGLGEVTASLPIVVVP